MRIEYDVTTGIRRELEDATVEYVEPPIQIPQTVSRFQALASLHQAGLLSTVSSIMESPSVDVITKLAWDNATSFNRNSPTLKSLSTLLSLTEQQVDDLFIMAGKIEA